MPDDVALRSLDRLRDTVDAQDDDLRSALGELIARNSSVNPGSHPVVEEVPNAADRVDAFLRRSAVLRDIDRTLVGAGGGLALDRQLWTGNTMVGQPNPPFAPRVDRFEPVHNGRSAPVHARPSGGLWTSTAVTGVVSGWSLWREVGAESSKFAGPAAPSWRLTPRPDVVVREIAGAGDWVSLISRHPRTTDVGVLPDWPAVADEYDAVHFTMTAAVALQGTSYRLPDESVTVPMYVDVESTVWLRWVFAAVASIKDGPISHLL